jgi:hypothetical protein
MGGTIGSNRNTLCSGISIRAPRLAAAVDLVGCMTRSQRHCPVYCQSSCSTVYHILSPEHNVFAAYMLPLLPCRNLTSRLCMHVPCPDVPPACVPSRMLLSWLPGAAGTCGASPPSCARRALTLTWLRAGSVCPACSP